ncbi:hypothetical protein AURDEDRAFT_161839 [Auricularia subglabra TFB-10046 SS5]|nr:hypothetical protein AURDEDRAFT_161839 [Auricularia subglabra TFB-10046 SS5]
MSQNPWGQPYSSPSPLSNNPFIDDPSAAHNRYPALDQSSAQYAASPSPSMLGYQQQQQPTGYYQSPGFAPSPPQLQPVATGYFSAPVQSPTVYSPSYAQSPYASVTGYGSGFLQPRQQQQQWQPQPANQAPGHLQQFDPLNPQAQSWSGQPQQQGSQLYGSSTPAIANSYNGGGAGARPDQHPRSWIRSHKTELESWDPVIWKQALARFDELQGAWERRKGEVQARVDAAMRGFIPPHEGPAWQGMLNEVNANIDTVAAAKFQMKEVLEGYNQSSDPASKRRVREFMNAGLSSLPEWPPQM